MEAKIDMQMTLPCLLDHPYSISTEECIQYIYIMQRRQSVPAFYKLEKSVPYTLFYV